MLFKTKFHFDNRIGTAPAYSSGLPSNRFAF
jgi:hypothetical protein